MTLGLAMGQGEYMNKSARWASRVGLTLAAIVAGILNGSVLAAPVLIFMVYLLSVLVTQGRAAVTLIEEERLRLAKARGAQFGREVLSELARPNGRVR